MLKKCSKKSFFFLCPHHLICLLARKIELFNGIFYGLFAGRMNELNLEFYDNLGVDPFKLLAEVGGFNTYTDMELVYPHIKNAKSILELGAGYGRCIDFLIARRYKGKIIAVEQSAKLASYLFDHYDNKVEILQRDIKELRLKEKVDAALWMWSGFIDFSPEEQEQSITRVAGFLNKDGKLVIDLPKIGFQTIAKHQDDKNVSFESPFGNLKCYIPDTADIKKYSDAAGFKNVFHQHYFTSTDKERTLYIFEK